LTNSRLSGKSAPYRIKGSSKKKTTIRRKEIDGEKGTVHGGINSGDGGRAMIKKGIPLEARVDHAGRGKKGKNAFRACQGRGRKFGVDGRDPAITKFHNEHNTHNTEYTARKKKKEENAAVVEE